MGSNSTIEPEEPKWGKGQFASHTWMEPVMVVVILFGAMYINRLNGYRIFSENKGRPLLDRSPSPRDSDDQIFYGEDLPEAITSTKYPPKKRNCFGSVILTPNSSRFAGNFHSRILQKFPFLIEMFYWIVNWLFYACTRSMTNWLFVKERVWDLAQAHGLSLLDIEYKSWLSFLFPVHEIDLQHWFMNGHNTALTFLNRAYSLIHIPGTVGFIAWYYFVAPNHATFAIVRRTMTLTNFIAFSIFTVFPCMPPRLLPPEYGFFDTVHHENAESVWTEGKYVNSLGAMPSLHFGYALCIGCTLIYHSGVFRAQRQNGETRKSKLSKAIHIGIGVGYPLLMVTVIISTANHYWLDVIAASFVVLIAFVWNRVFMILLPLEDMLLWVLRLEKPVPSTGKRFYK